MEDKKPQVQLTQLSCTSDIIEGQRIWNEVLQLFILVLPLQFPFLLNVSILIVVVCTSIIFNNTFVFLSICPFNSIYTFSLLGNLLSCFSFFSFYFSPMFPLSHYNDFINIFILSYWHLVLWLLSLKHLLFSLLLSNFYYLFIQKSFLFVCFIHF